MQEFNTTSEEELLLKDEEISVKEEIDYSSLTKSQLLKHLKDLQTQDMAALHSELANIKSAYDELFNEEKQEAFNKFLEEGGIAADFEYRLDEVSRNFEKLFQDVNTRLKAYLHQRKDQELQAQRKKNSIVEELREIVNSHEVSTASFTKIKELQQAWKEALEATAFTDKELWRSYKALLDIYYNNRSISFELMELDRKKNLEAKIALCEQVESLATEPSVRAALQSLSGLHKEYKIIGPVPEEERENVWQRFKQATQVIYNKREQYEAELEEQKKVNAQLKAALLDKLELLIQSNTEKIADWNGKTNEVLDLQKEWKQVGPLDKEEGSELSKKFWARVKDFYRLKGGFFSALDDERKQNLRAKEALCEEVEALKDNEHFKSTADKIKGLQAAWKKVGPVPQKHSDAVYKRFRTACDYFFDRQKSFFGDKEAEFIQNYEQKLEVIKSIDALQETQVNEFEQLLKDFDALGFVPKDKKEQINQAFKKSTTAFLAKLPEGNAKDTLEISVELGSLKGNPNAASIVGKRRDKIRAEINEIKGDINTLKTNIEFFARSKNAASLRQEVEKKVAEAEVKVNELKRKLQLINNFEF